ncbi:hypothetical protein IKG20_03280 [Candidatus Saccharibacteria bacterium]|nr:hypothetical protein [Candidatus Saccharibacteria bacterium]
MELKPKTSTFSFIGAGILGIIAVVIFASQIVKPKDTSAYTAPKIAYLETDGPHVIVHAKSAEPNIKEQFVYCVLSTEESNNCSWDNSDEFDLEEEGDYYFFVKSLASGKVSSSKLMTYKIVDYTEFRM